MTETFTVEAQTRQDVGKGASRRLRKQQNLVPGVVYGADKPAQAIMLAHNKLLKSLETEAFYSQILTLNIEGKAEKVILKDLQRHPFKPIILHADFLRIKAGEKMHVNIPLHFIGEEEAPGVKEGGIVSHQMNEVEITCLPENLPQFIEVDVSALAMDSTIHLQDLTLPEGIALTALELDNESNPTVASIHKPRAAVEEEASTAEEGEVAASDSEAAAESPTEDKPADSTE